MQNIIHNTTLYLKKLSQNTNSEQTGSGTKIVTKSKPVLITLFSVFVLSLTLSIFLLFNPVFIISTNLTSNADSFVYNGVSFNYTTSGSVATITGLNTTTNITDMAIPASITVGVAPDAVTYAVTVINNYSFENKTNLKGDLTIPNSVTNIGKAAFSGCSGLTSITIPNSVTSIGSSAFSRCSGLTSITIPDSVTSIGERAFFGCSGLTGNLIIGNSVTSIGYDAFSGCGSLESITVDANNGYYKSINNCLISNSSNSLILGCKNSIIPDNITSIGDSAFSGCSGLINITIPSSVTSIGTYAFDGTPY